MTSTEIFDAIRRHYGKTGFEWAVLREVRCGTGFDFSTGGGYRWRSTMTETGTHWEKVLMPYQRPSREQRLDALAINLWPSSKFARVAFEIKISRADFMREINNPVKREYAMLLAHQFYFVVPEGLVGPDAIPPDCGLATVHGSQMSIVKQAPKHECEPLPQTFLAVLARRAAVAEEKLRQVNSSPLSV